MRSMDHDRHTLGSAGRPRIAEPGATDGIVSTAVGAAAGRL